MKTIVKNSFLAIALATVAFACNQPTAENTGGLVDTTAVTEPTVDEAMNTSPDTATVVRTDSTALQETKQAAGEAKDAVKSGASEVKSEAKDAAH